MSEASQVRVWDCLFHEHNDGGIFGVMSKGGAIRQTMLDVRDNKVARTQDKTKVSERVRNRTRLS